MCYTHTHAHSCCGHAEAPWWHAPHPWMHAMHGYMPMPVVPIEKPKFKIPFIESIDPLIPTKEFIVGGLDPSHLTLEYMKAEGAVAPVIKIAILGPGGTTVTWNDPAVADGYHLKTDFAPLQAGSKIIVSVTEVVARLRWCETFHCS